MTTKPFSDLAQSVKESWTQDTRTVYEAASASFTAELAAQADLGAMLAAARTSRHLSQPELSRVAGVQQAEISRIENGRGNPTLATIERLARALNVRVALVDADPAEHHAA